MKAKDFIIIGGAIALYYLYQKNKTITSSTSTKSASEGVKDDFQGGGMPSGETPKPSTPKPSTPKGGTKLGGTTSGSGAVFTGTVTPIEVAIQQGGVSTTPQPAIVPAPVLSTEESLVSSGVAPIVKPERVISIDPQPLTEVDTRPLINNIVPNRSLGLD